MLLSICIPTYNRADYLEKTLISLVTQDCWQDGDCEVVISDNASSDRTWEVIADFARKFPGRVRGERQEPPIHAHINFEKSMRMGQGTFLKLNNDTLSWKPGMLREYMELLREYKDVSDMILTPNSPAAPVYGKSAFHCKNIGEIVDKCSYFLTWIGCFCVRRSSFLSLQDPSRNLGSRLTQMDMILRLAASGCGNVVDSRIFFETQTIVRRAEYQVAEVFAYSYFDILQEYAGKELPYEIFEKEKRRMLFEFLIPRYFDFFNEYNCVRQYGYWKNTAVYHRNFYFYMSFVQVGFMWLISRFFSHDSLQRIKYFLGGKKRSS